MPRRPWSIAIVSAAVLAAGTAFAAPDRVVYRDAKAGKDVIKEGAIVKETPESVEMKGMMTPIPVKDLVSVTHGDAPAEFQQAEEAELSLDFGPAAELYRRALDAKNVGPWIQHDARFRRADCLYRSGELAQAAQGFKELLEKAPEGRFRSRAQLRLGQSLLFQKSYAEAKSALDALRNARGWEEAAGACWLARVQEAQGDVDGARRAYEEAATRYGGLHPDVKDMARARAALCDVAKGKAAEALKDLLTAVEASSPDKAGGAALRNACGQAQLALAKAAKGDEGKRLAFAALMDFCRVLVYGEAHAEEHAAAYAGAEAALQLLGDSRAAQYREDRQRFYKDAFITG